VRVDEWDKERYHLMCIQMSGLTDLSQNGSCLFSETAIRD